MLERLVQGFGIICALMLLVGGTKALSATESFMYRIGSLNVMVINDTTNRFAASLFPTLEQCPDAKPFLQNNAFPGIVRTFLLKTKEHTILVDAGWGKEMGREGRTVEILASAGIAPSSITDILLTHLDVDHISGLVSQGKVVYPNATLWMNPAQYEAWIVRGDARDARSVQHAQKIIALYEKAGKLAKYSWGTTVLPGITALKADGHTYGHTVFVLSTGANPFYLVGDLLHAGDLQLRHPECNSKYDADGNRAREARKEILSRCAQEKAVIAGAHFLPVGVVQNDGKGGFRVLAD